MDGIFSTGLFPPFFLNFGLKSKKSFALLYFRTQTEWKNYCFYVWFKNKQVWTSLDGKNWNLTKKYRREKSLRFLF